MTIRKNADGVVLLEGDCVLEEAEELQRLLLDDPRPAVDWRACTAAHTAVIQVLLVARAALHGPPEGEFLRAFVDPLLQPDGRAANAGVDKARMPAHRSLLPIRKGHSFR
jgi:hypothetical protein